MFRNQLTALITHERITTTVAKAKELRPLAERMVTLARTGTLANRRRVMQTLTDKTVAKRLFDDVAPRFANRPGGYTRIVRIGRRRGDNAELAIIEFVDYEPKFDEAAGKGKSSLMDRAKGIFGGRQDEASADGDVSASAEAEAAGEAEEAIEDEAIEEPLENEEPELDAAEDTAEPEEPEAEAKAEEAEEPAAESVESDEPKSELKAEASSADADAVAEPETEAPESEEPVAEDEPEAEDKKD
jgi:large subunit ribosomal protein L17